MKIIICGYGGVGRTREMSESNSDTLPLGYSAILLFLIITLLFVFVKVT